MFAIALLNLVPVSYHSIIILFHTGFNFYSGISLLYLSLAVSMFLFYKLYQSVVFLPKQNIGFEKHLQIPGDVLVSKTKRFFIYIVDLFLANFIFGGLILHFIAINFPERNLSENFQRNVSIYFSIILFFVIFE